MKYPKDTAGRIMTTAVPVVPGTVTVAEVEKLLRTKTAAFDSINYIYLTNDMGSLGGVISIKELLSLPSQAVLQEHAKTELVFARPHTDQERLAQLALQNSLKAIPVLSHHNNEFLGVVPSDRILEVLKQEHTEDVLRFAGVSHHGDDKTAVDVLLNTSVVSHVKRRLPWLVLGLFGGGLAALVVGQFEATLAGQIILAAFIPAIVYMADAVGSQTQMLFVRALSLNAALPVGKYLAREVMVNFMLGLVLSALTFVLAWWIVGSLLISAILAVSIFLTVCFTVLVGVTLPWFFHVRGFDPAIASGPLATVVRDIMSLLIYLAVATLFLYLWGGAA